MSKMAAKFTETQTARLISVRSYKIMPVLFEQAHFINTNVIVCKI